MEEEDQSLETDGGNRGQKEDGEKKEDPAVGWRRHQREADWACEKKKRERKGGAEITLHGVDQYHVAQYCD